LELDFSRQEVSGGMTLVVSGLKLKIPRDDVERTILKIVISTIIRAEAEGYRESY
jgi:hypothetical protein